MTYRVSEEFASFQGEGTHAGVPAYFIRLAGCSVAHCPIRAVCDTDYAHKYDASANELADRAGAAKSARFVVVTGGEPFDQDMPALADALNRRGLRAHVETSGLHDAERAGFHWIAMSPKARASQLKNRWANDVKVVYVGQPIHVLREYEPFGRNMLLQPRWADGAMNIAATLDALAQLPPPWRLSLQTHKFAGVR